MTADQYKELRDFLEAESKEFSVVVMPDFFLDRLISLEWDPQTFFGKVEGAVCRKGGSLDGIRQSDLRGGNAVNTASALTALGVEVTPIVCTSSLGLELLKFHLRLSTEDLSHVKPFNQASMTTALELKTAKGKTNVMLRDVGALSDFGPQHLNTDDFKAVERADYVCVFNWAGTKLYGTQLAKTIFHRTKTKGIGRTYYDTADPVPNEGKIPELTEQVLRSRDVDILSVNENEALCYAEQVSGRVFRLKGRLQTERQAMEAARILASCLSARIDLHTTSFSATFNKGEEALVPAFEVPVRRATGAGDAWNAGNILGDAHGLSDSCRLTLANAVAACYVSGSTGDHATREHLRRFCQNSRTKKLL